MSPQFMDLLGDTSRMLDPNCKLANRPIQTFEV